MKSYQGSISKVGLTEPLRAQGSTVTVQQFNRLVDSLKLQGRAIRILFEQVEHRIEEMEKTIAGLRAGE